VTVRLALLAALVGAAACSSGGGGQAAATPRATAPARVTATPAPAATPTLPPNVAPTVTATPPPATPVPGAPAANPPPLTFTGGMSGQAAGVTSAGVCGRAPAGFAANLRFSLSGHPYALSIALLDYHGPGSYAIPPERVSVQSGSDPGGQFQPAIRGSLTVDAGERSGRIDAVIGDGSTRVSGAWACT